MNNQFEEKNALMENLIACTNSDNYKIRAAAYTALGNFLNRFYFFASFRQILVYNN